MTVSFSTLFIYSVLTLSIGTYLVVVHPINENIIYRYISIAIVATKYLFFFIISVLGSKYIKNNPLKQQPKWIIYLQDLTELAYFKGDIRKCSYEIEWDDEDGQKQRTYIALRGPVETKIDYIQKHGISVDNPNYSLNFLLPKTVANVKQFKRYSKFYLQDLIEGEDKVCWRVEAVDTFSTPGIIEVTAVEYYANEFEDDVDAGKVGTLIKKPVDPNTETESEFVIVGETFIKPKKEYIYYIDSSLYGQWYLSDNKIPIIKEEFEDELGRNSIKIKWDSPYSGQFDLWFGDSHGPLFDYKKTIVVESLF